jgi:hypothetical protein
MKNAKNIAKVIGLFNILLTIKVSKISIGFEIKDLFKDNSEIVFKGREKKNEGRN